METKITHILLADDNKGARSALALILETPLDAPIVGEAATMECLLERVVAAHPDVVQPDWELPGKPEADRISVIRSVLPGTSVIVISARPESAAQAVDGDAFVNKIDLPEHILAVLKERNKP